MRATLCTYTVQFVPIAPPRTVNVTKCTLANQHFVARTRRAATSATFVPYSQPFVALTRRWRTSATKCCLAPPPGAVDLRAARRPRSPASSTRPPPHAKPARLALLKTRGPPLLDPAEAPDRDRDHPGGDEHAADRIADEVEVDAGDQVPDAAGEAQLVGEDGEQLDGADDQRDRHRQGRD